MACLCSKEAIPKGKGTNASPLTYLVNSRRETCMSPDQVERVAKAFYAAEHAGGWNDAPGAMQQRFRELARMAIIFLHEQASHRRASRVQASATGGPHGEEVKRLSS